MCGVHLLTAQRPRSWTRRSWRVCKYRGQYFSMSLNSSELITRGLSEVEGSSLAGMLMLERQSFAESANAVSNSGLNDANPVALLLSHNPHVALPSSSNLIVPLKTKRNKLLDTPSDLPISRALTLYHQGHKSTHCPSHLTLGDHATHVVPA
jgi:hypothetical protein